MPRPSSQTGVIVNRSEIARMLGVAPTTIDNWALAGMPVETSGGRKRYNSRDILEWRARQAKGAAGSLETSDDEDLEDDEIGPEATGEQRVSFTEARRRKEVALAEQREIEVLELRKKLIHRDELASSLAKIGQVIREGLERLVVQAASEIHAARDEWEAREIAQKAVSEVLIDASNNLTALVASDSGDGERDSSDSSGQAFGVGGPESASIV